ncbi:MAG: hypothetical protein A2X94_05800 [Bdellovibrionales bacterium GWB1_55_8]|nr:MAG: hypothetical protein A2X94_05800 [Bdellovibrionales bacterium GWB1_55_8]
MLSKLFLGMSLIGAEWVLYLLVVLSIVSIAVIVERAQFYRSASGGLADFRRKLRQAVSEAKWTQARELAQARLAEARNAGKPADLETEMSFALLEGGGQGEVSVEKLAETAQDSVLRNRVAWEGKLAILATIGSNAPFIGLFGTVLGIIKAFHDLSQQVGGGAQGVTAGISEALVATGVGILVAIPAVVAFNLFQRRLKAGLGEAEALKCFLIGKISR